MIEEGVRFLKILDSESRELRSCARRPRLSWQRGGAPLFSSRAVVPCSFDVFSLLPVSSGAQSLYKECSTQLPVKPCKLAAEDDRGGGLLIPAREPDDSGIDSDDAVRRLILAHQRQPFSDESSSDDELHIPSPTTHRNNERKASMKKFEKENDLVIMQWPQDEFKKDQNVAREPSPDRSSPLYEVELTASDEDDDASVLELVIPMHSSRYQRVPTSSPKKTKPKVAKRYFCSMICCGRK